MSYLFGPEAFKKGILNIYSHSPIWDEEFETIERKGLGHPDTIADILASKISQKYSQYTYQNCDKLVLHHQVDKLMVIGGKTKVYFGGGEFLEPIRIIVAGRATYSYQEKVVPVEDIVVETIQAYFKEHFPMVDLEKDLIIENRLTGYAGPGTITTSAGAIARMFNPKDKDQVRGYEKYVANDTSYCLSYYPYSKLETAILLLEQYLQSNEAKKIYPWLGSDIKIMAVRNRQKVSITMCVPQISTYVSSLNEYWENLKTIGAIVNNFFQEKTPEYSFEISINTKDDYDKFNVYLTYTGSSLVGDIGVVGRGNRTNGLITSNRPMSMEGTSGKNPRYYSGFIYAILTKQIAKTLFDELGQPALVEIVSQNGGSLLDPWQARIVCAADPEAIKRIYESSLKKIPDITSSFIKGGAITY